MQTELRIIRRVVVAVSMAVALLALAGLAAAQGGDPPLQATLDPDAPAITHGESGAFDDRFTDGGAFFYHDGQFHMFRNGFRQWPGEVGITYHTSADGLTWEQASDGPLFVSSAVPFGQQAALASSVVVEDGGTWVLYFHTVGNQFSDDPHAFSIGRATASGPLGPWTIDSEPVLLPGSAGTWDQARVGYPSVVKTDGEYRMYYAGYAETNGERQIGLATSADGVTWTKFDDPATTDARFAESDPVLRPGEPGAWDAAFAGQPNVVQTPDGFVMTYRSAGGSGARGQGYGLALSEDGVNWRRVGDAPFFGDAMTTRRHVWWHGLAYGEGTYYLGVEIQRGYQNESDIYTGVLSGDPFQ